jgi:hypothetical protein
VRYTVPAALVVLLGLWGCASAPAARTAVEGMTAERVVEAIRSNSGRLVRMEGSGKLMIDAPEVRESASFSLYLRKPDTVMIRVEGPFGIEVGSALLTSTSFTLYNSLRHQVLTGPSSAENLSRVLRMKITFDDVVELFTGAAPVSDADIAGQRVSIENQEYTFTTPGESGTRQYWIDPTTLLVTRLVQFGAGGNLMLEQRLGGYKTVNGVSVPSTVRFTQHAERRMLTITYSSLALNNDARPLRLRFPESAARVELR